LNTQQLISGVAQRYARSLFALAQEQGKTEAVTVELAALQKALGESADFLSFTLSPIIPAQQQVETLKTLFTKFGVSALTANFVQLLAQNRRLNLLNETIIAYGQLLDKSKGLMKAEVTPAEPLSDQQQRALKDALKITTGKDVAIDAHIDQSLIGGLIIRLGSRMLDTSLKTKLASLKVALKGTA
jgi:F-type H+-transporting ATPase subunit delta